MHEAGFQCDGRLLALNSYENRVYQLGMDDGPPQIVKFYRPQRWTDEAILEEHAFVAELHELEIPVVPALVSADGRSLPTHAGFRFAVFPRQGGRAPELDQADTREWLGRFIGRIHAAGAQKNYQHRANLDIDSFGHEPRAYLLAHDCIPADLVAAYKSITNLVLDGIARSYERAGTMAMIRLHGDCHLGNVLWTDGGPHFVDFDDSRMGPAIQDLWLLLSGTRADMTAQFSDILFGYEDFAEFQPRQLHLIEALRSLRMLHYSAWLAQRWDDPAFKQAFPWFNTQRYWQDRILELREQVALMDEPPLAV
ncbi:serine/threonine protein kinase [Undibacterium sp. Jales W-56]|nr:serine/threonine protein kinase [Undibacterium sp. Jales W-56]